MTENLQIVFNGYISNMRNMYTTSSIGLASLALSNRLKNHKNLLKILSLSIFLYSAFYGFNSTRYFYQYLKLMRNKKNLSEFDQLQLNHGSEWIYLSYIYIFILIVLCFVILIK